MMPCVAGRSEAPDDQIAWACVRVGLGNVTTSRKGAASADEEYDEDDIPELEYGTAAYNFLHAILPTFSPLDTGNT
jgi:hypothetical protein